jgi:DNA-binding transcriptional regulator LsrR (DeoR family)
MSSISDEYTSARLIGRVVSMYYLEELSQVEISKALDLSTAKVNRLIKQARELGMVEIRVHNRFQNIFDLERQIEKTTGVREAVIVPQFTRDEAAVLQSIGQAAASYLLDHIRDGDVICMGGGRAILEVVRAVRTTRSYDVRVVPAIGGVQGRHYTDVNYLAAELAGKLGGLALQLHAPAFVDSQPERDSLCALRHVKEVLDLARQAQIALVGVGSLADDSSSYFQFTSLSPDEVQHITNERGGAGEILSQILDGKGEVIAREYAGRVVGLELRELKAIPLSIGVAATPGKALAIAGALAGGFLKTIISDDATGMEIRKIYSHGE